MSRSRVARLHPDGSVDDSFVPPTINGSVWALDMQSDGSVVIGGEFTQVNGDTMRVARLHANGSFDGSFKVEADGNIHEITIDPTTQDIWV